MIDNFAGKTAVLTGAGSGFGLECARMGARLGMNLVLVDVQQDALDAAAAEMQAAGAQVLARRVDVSSATQMEQLAAEVAQRFGAPQLVFNNAGVGAGGLVWENSVKDWEWVLGVNLMGVVHGVRLFTPMMLAAAKKDPNWRGHIVNTASMAGLLTPPNMGIYNVSKHAVDHAPDVDAHHPVPVLHRVFPDQATRADAGVVEHEVRRAEALFHEPGQAFHLVLAGHVDPARKHLHARGLDLGGGLVQRVLLHVHQHQVHAQLGADAGALQPETRPRAGEHRRLALEVLNHVCLLSDVM